MSMYDYDLKVPNIEQITNEFTEASTQEKPDYDKMIRNFNALVDAFHDLEDRAQTVDSVRENASSRVSDLNETMNGLMQERLAKTGDDGTDEGAAKKEEALKAAKENAFKKAFGEI